MYRDYLTLFDYVDEEDQKLIRSPNFGLFVLLTISFSSAAVLWSLVETHYRKQQVTMTTESLLIYF